MNDKTKEDKTIKDFLNGNSELSKLLDISLNQKSTGDLDEKTKDHILRLMREEKEKNRASKNWYIPASVAASFLIIFGISRFFPVGYEAKITETELPIKKTETQITETKKLDNEQDNSDEISEMPYELANMPANNRSKNKEGDISSCFSPGVHGKDEHVTTVDVTF